MNYWKNLKIIEDEYKKVMAKLSEPETTSNPEKIKEYGKKASELEEGVKTGWQVQGSAFLDR